MLSGLTCCRLHTWLLPLVTHKSNLIPNLVPRVLLGTKVPWWIVAQILGNNLLLYFPDVPGLKLTPFNCSIKMSVYYIASLKINYFIAQNLGNKTKPRDHDPPGYFRSQKYPGYEVALYLGYLLFGQQNILLTNNK